MTDFEKWEWLKADTTRAVEDGFNCGYHANLGTEDFGRFVAFRYVLDLMNDLDVKDK